MVVSLVIVGAGGHGKVVAEAAALGGRWDQIAFVDDARPKGERVAGFEIIGATGDLENLRSDFADAAIGIGDNGTRLLRAHRIAEAGFHLPAIIHPTASISPSAVVGAGTVIFAQAAVNAEARLGTAVIVNTGAVVEHDCIIGDGAHLSPGVHMGGHVVIGERAWIGTGTAIVPRAEIGSGTIVGAGAAVTGNLPENAVAVGVPAKVLEAAETAIDG
jgi:sugar O-acyltransferase (sialic acid O-acetyltransferase NeuD family)